MTDDKTKNEILDYTKKLGSLINEINEKYILRIHGFYPIEGSIHLGVFTKDFPLIGITGWPERFGITTKVKYYIGDLCNQNDEVEE